MSTRLVDQPAIWFPTEMRTVRRYQPTEIKRQRIQFETVAAAVIYATSTLPEGFRPNATIETENNIALHWADIEEMRKTLTGEQWGRPDSGKPAGESGNFGHGLSSANLCEMVGP